MNIGIIGTGKMGGMLARSLVRFGALPPGRLWLANRSTEKLAQLAGELPGIRTADAAVVAAACPMIFLCVKPAETAAALALIEECLTADHLLLVISNMLDISEIEAQVTARIAKVIPSLAQTVGGGVVLLMYGSRVQPQDRTRLERLMATIGRPLVIQEHQGRTCSDITSCGPAFMAYILWAMADAAALARPDLPLGTIQAMVAETALATARLLTEGGYTPAEIIAPISVPGGITTEGLRILRDFIPTAWTELFGTTHAMEEFKKTKLKV